MVFLGGKSLSQEVTNYTTIIYSDDLHWQKGLRQGFDDYGSLVLHRRYTTSEVFFNYCFMKFTVIRHPFLYQHYTLLLLLLLQ